MKAQVGIRESGAAPMRVVRQGECETTSQCIGARVSVAGGCNRYWYQG